MDMKDQWVRLPKGPSSFEEDWQAQLEVRAAEAFRLPELFTDWFRAYSVSPTPDTLFEQPEHLWLAGRAGARQHRRRGGARTDGRRECSGSIVCRATAGGSESARSRLGET